MRDARCFAMWCETPLALNYEQVQCSWCNWQGLELGPQALPTANAYEINTEQASNAPITSFVS